MARGWVLIGSGQYGYHYELGDEYVEFIERNYWWKGPYDFLLSKQKSPIYFYFADKGLNGRPEPIPVEYENLNERQKRVFDITTMSSDRIVKEFLMPVEDQAVMTEEDALNTGKYIAFVSSKTVNDFGRRFLLYDCTSGNTKFLGVVLITGEAKRDDWTGLGSPTSSVFDFRHFPLSTRETDGWHWGLDIPQNLYEYLGGDGGPITGLLLVDPDKDKIDVLYRGCEEKLYLACPTEPKE